MKNVFYFYHINEIGGVETFFWNLARKYQDHDIVVLYTTGDQAQVDRLRKYVSVRRWRGEQIICERFFTNYNTSILPKVTAKEVVQIIHADYKRQGLPPNVDPYVDRYVGVSAVACDSFQELTGKEIELCYNPLVVEKPKKVKRLVSATRLTPEKGRVRIEKLANIMDEAGIRYEWTIYSNDKQPFQTPNITIRKPRLDIADFIADADFLVQLSDAEAYCYTVVESLCLGTPVIVTDLPVYDELGLDATNSIRVDLDLKHVPIPKIRKGLPRVEGFKPPEDKWEELLVPAKSDYWKANVKVVCRLPFRDLTTGMDRVVGERWETYQARADDLKDKELVDIL